MNEALLKRLGLKPDASIEEIETAIHAHLDQIGELKERVEQLKETPPETNVQKLESAIARKISESGGALNRVQALIAIQHQEEHGNKSKPAKKK
jgi:predicted transposase YdaD